MSTNDRGFCARYMAFLHSKSAQWLSEIARADGYAFIIGGGFQMIQVREIGDLDILVSASDLHRLRSQPLPRNWKRQDVVSDNGIDTGVLIAGDLKMEFFCGSYPKGFGYRDMQRFDFSAVPPVDPLSSPLTLVHSGLHANIMAWSLETTIRWKAAFNRPKDRNDIVALLRR